MNLKSSAKLMLISQAQTLKLTCQYELSVLINAVVICCALVQEKFNVFYEKIGKQWNSSPKIIKLM